MPCFITDQWLSYCEYNPNLGSLKVDFEDVRQSSRLQTTDTVPNAGLACTTGIIEDTPLGFGHVCEGQELNNDLYNCIFCPF